MKPRYTWLWTTLALGLFAFIFFFERHWQEEPVAPARVLPSLDLASVSSVQVRPAGQFEIRAERTNGVWWLTRPLAYAYPGEAAQIEGLLTNLAQLVARAHISAAELRTHTNADVEFGLDVPQASLLIQDRDRRHQLLVGARTPPGDEVYLQVVGIEGLHIVSADLLKRIPQSPAAWRETRFVNLERLVFDRILVTNAGAAFELQRDVLRQSWRLADAINARADAAKVEAALQALRQLRVTQFVTDDPNADAESYGLQPPDLSLTFVNHTNPVMQLRFGKSPTNDASQVFARRFEQPAIVKVPRDVLSPWRVPAGEFRDLHLLSLTRPVQTIEMTGTNTFTLQCIASNAWRVLPLDLPADLELVQGLTAALGSLQATQLLKDVVIEPDLPKYGLAPPAHKVTVKSTPFGGGTNVLLAELEFGSAQADQTFVRRTDEASVYTVKTTDLQPLFITAFQLRDRSIWHVDETDVARITVQQGGKMRQLQRHGADSWSIVAGQGIINPFGVEETVHRLGGLYAIQWVARGPTDVAQYGFTADGLQVTLELNSGAKLEVRFGGTAPSQLTYGATTLEGQVWVFECPPTVSESVRLYLAIPSNVP